MRGEKGVAGKGMTTAKMAAMGGRGGGGKALPIGEEIPQGTTAATAGAATAATVTGPEATLSSLHSLVMLSKRPPKIVQQMAPRGEGADHHQGGEESRDCAWGGTVRCGVKICE